MTSFPMSGVSTTENSSRVARVQVRTRMGGVQAPDSIEVEGDCVQDPTNAQRATGEIQAGDTQECTFINFVD